MGKELTNQGTINSYEMINHKSDIFLWLHQVLDDVKTIKFASFENLVNAVYDLLSDAFTPEDSSMIGEVKMWSAATAPDKWLLCNGVAISRTTYSTLFALIGSTYGEGDGTTTFNLPDFRGRAPIGAGQGSGLTNRTLGTSLGEEAHGNTIAENGPHEHTGASHSHLSGAHKHGQRVGGASLAFKNAYGGSGEFYSPGQPTDASGGRLYTDTDGGGIPTSSGGTNNTGSSGSGAPHNTMPPSLVVNFIIYSGVSEL